MTWTYNIGSLATSTKDAIRFELYDTDTNNQLIQDEEISYAITQERNFWAAAARCAEAISRRFLAKADVRLGRSLMLTYTKTAEQYKVMALQLRRKAMGTVVPWVGGMTLSDKQGYEQDTSMVQPAFARTMMENPRTGGFTADQDDTQANQAVSV